MIHLRRAGLLPLFLLSACAFGNLRQSQVEPLGAWREVRAAQVTTSGTASPETLAQLQQGSQDTFPAALHLAEAVTGDVAFRLDLHVEKAVAPQGDLQGFKQHAGARLSNALGFGGANAAAAGRLEVAGLLYAPDRAEPVGRALWVGIGDPDVLAADAGSSLGRALAKDASRQRSNWIPRRAADERLFLTPTPLTVPKGRVSFSDDELLLFRVAMGLSEHLQLDSFFGGLPVPAIGGAVLPLPGGIVAAGGGGGAVFGVYDLGLKWRFLDETPNRPAIAVSYDVINLFLIGLGGGGGVGLGGSGAAGGGFVGVGGAHIQFNLFMATIGKHFGNTHVVAGGGILDNHHWMGQSASFVAACGGVATDGNGAAAGVTKCSGSTPIDRLPTTAAGFLSVEQVLGPHSSLGMEAFPRYPLQDSLVTTGARWLFGGDKPIGPLAWDRLRLRLDFALAWFYMPANAQANRPHAGVGYVPWLGLGVHVM